MPESSTERNRRHRRHKAGDHALCSPDRCHAALQRARSAPAAPAPSSPASAAGSPLLTAAHALAAAVPPSCAFCAARVALLLDLAAGSLSGPMAGQWRGAVSDLQGCDHGAALAPEVDVPDELAEHRRRTRDAARAEALRQTDERQAADPFVVLPPAGF